ncbi:hypothetical protein VPNG_03291 [Cytospora leucostoma]|uniref:Uncharacterized protein n=1 Tax=Cytospora leucostoma TaxID=1230097 RepID=A0A423XEI8_9PEZI|nr:hypothetical protein VPNG_03291 [Cytospora leucostoma]
MAFADANKALKVAFAGLDEEARTKVEIWASKSVGQDEAIEAIEAVAKAGLHKMSYARNLPAPTATGEKTRATKYTSAPARAPRSRGGRPGAGPTSWTPSGVELELLGLDRSRDTVRSGAAPDEEARCDGMRRPGARWWESEWHYSMSVVVDFSDLDDVDYRYGYGVYGGGDDGGGGGGEGFLHGRVAGWGWRERCEVVEELGGVFYADPRDCPDLDLP